MRSDSTTSEALIEWAKSKGISMEADVHVKSFEHGGRGLAAGICAVADASDRALAPLQNGCQMAEDTLNINIIVCVKQVLPCLPVRSSYAFPVMLLSRAVQRSSVNLWSLCSKTRKQSLQVCFG